MLGEISANGTSMRRSLKIVNTGALFTSYTVVSWGPLTRLRIWRRRRRPDDDVGSDEDAECGQHEQGQSQPPELDDPSLQCCEGAGANGRWNKCEHAGRSFKCRTITLRARPSGRE